MNLEEEFNQLQLQFAYIDLFAKSTSGMLEVLLLKKQNMKIKIYQEQTHHMPHIHIDYGSNNHVASYSIETGEKLEGNLEKKYDVVVVNWLRINREKVIKVWNELQSGNSVDYIIKELQAN